MKLTVQTRTTTAEQDTWRANI